MKQITLLFICCNLSIMLFAQSDSIYSLDYLDKSTRFASFTLGADVLARPGGNTTYIQNGVENTSDFGWGVTPRVTLGGLHFWGHADFYVSFPLNFLDIQGRAEPFSKLTNQQGIETGARVYPWSLKPNSLRPFAGISFRTHTFNQTIIGEEYEEGSPQYEKFIAPIQGGITYASNKWLISASVYYQLVNELDYAISTTQWGRVTTNPWSFNISVLKYWDSDKHMRTGKATRELNYQHRLLEENNKLSTWYWALGPSAALQVSKSPFLQRYYPYLQHDFLGGFMPDVAFGRFFHKPDMNIGLSYRTFGDRIKGFDSHLRFSRHSFMIETYKNLFNWLGFVPFVGVTGSIELLNAKVNASSYQEVKPAVGAIFGWDIRVTKTGTSLLRTNLRWIPNLHMSIDGEKMMFNHLEFNFIQWVQFIGRKKVYKNAVSAN